MKNIPKSAEEYHSIYRKSTDNPEAFWEEVAESFVWKKKWNSVLEWNKKESVVRWFEGGELNITENCIDRHLDQKGDQTAILWEPNDPKDPAEHITYRQLHERVCKMANALKGQGVGKGDRVCIYMPMVPEVAYVALACARIGAIHSVVFAGFSSSSLAARINDADCKVLITTDGSKRGSRVFDLKAISDEAVSSCGNLEKVLVYPKLKDSFEPVGPKEENLKTLFDAADSNCPAEPMQSEDPLFILYTSGSTGRPKGMVHTTAGYMVYTTYTFLTAFQYQEGDVYWCTADVGWITGHSYIIYGPLSAGATTVMFEGAPSYPDWGRFWEVCEKHKVNHFYTAPTAIRSLLKQPLEYVEKYDLSALKVLGSVGEPINEEAWHWYDEHIGKKKCPILDTWWQTETGGFMISPIAGVSQTKPTFAGNPIPGIEPALFDKEGNEIQSTSAEGLLGIKRPWPSMARTIWGNHERYQNTYFSTLHGLYFTGDGALRDEEGFYRITGRVDDVIIVSGHNLGTAPIENAINEHDLVVESAVVGFPHDIKGKALYGFVIVTEQPKDEDLLVKEVNKQIATSVGAIAKLDKIQFVEALPRTRSGKIMRRILRKIAENQLDSLGDTSTLLNPESVEKIIEHRK